jgi:hypothetical protein
MAHLLGILGMGGGRGRRRKSCREEMEGADERRFDKIRSGGGSWISG